MTKTVKAPPPPAASALLSERARLESELRSFLRAVKPHETATIRAFSSFAP